MLEKLIIENVALVERAEINFTDGLNVLSGETGAGKSVILDALNFVLGAKADKTLIKSNADFCRVTAVFSNCINNKIATAFNELEFDIEDEIIITRKFSLDGKSSIKLNGNTVTSSMLKKITSNLVDIHGQSEHYELLSNSNQLKLLDLLGEDVIIQLKTKLKLVYLKYKDVISKIDDLGGDSSQRAIRLDVLNYQINEITNANLYDGEEDNLLDIRSRLNNQEKILSSLSCLKGAIREENAVCDILNSALRSISYIGNLNSKYEDLSQRLSNVIAELVDIADCGDTYIEEVSDVEYNSQEIEDRLDLIKSLKRKYGSDYQSIITFLNEAIAEKEKLENYDDLYNNLISEKSVLEKELYDYYLQLSLLRKKVSNDFVDKVVLELKDLGMPNSTFTIEFAEPPSIENCRFNSQNGFDEIKYLFSANLGQPVKPLSEVISGGEISRFMLSIKAQSSKYNEISTYVFDEIDAGISGLIALEVAKKFAKISKDVQIIAISHLPQISAMADNNLLISKHESNANTFTTVKQLSLDEKIQEIVRLVGGIDSDSAKKLALELIDKSNSFKKSL